MLSEHERIAFEQIVRNLGPLESSRYLMPWWMPPAVLAFYGLLLVGAALTIPASVLLPLAVVTLLVSGLWGRHRRRSSAGDPPLDLSSTPPFIA